MIRRILSLFNSLDSSKLLGFGDNERREIMERIKSLRLSSIEGLDPLIIEKILEFVGHGHTLTKFLSLSHQMQIHVLENQSCGKNAMFIYQDFSIPISKHYSYVINVTIRKRPSVLQEMVEDSNCLSFSFLSNFPNLLSLCVSNQRLFDDGQLEFIPKFRSGEPNLRKLEIIECPSFSGENLSKLYHLNELIVRGNSNIRDQYLVRLINLESLTIQNCRNFRGSCILKMMNRLKKLVIEEGLFWSNLDDSMLVGLKRLEHLELGWCRFFMGYTLQEMKSLRKLKIVEGVEWSNIEDEMIHGFEQKLSSLELVNTGNVIGTCFKRMLNLKSLSIVNNEDVNDRIFSNLDSVKSLSLVDCPDIHGHGIRNLLFLEELEIRSDANMEETNLFGESDEGDEKERIWMFQRLRKVSIIKCPKMSFKSFKMLPNLRVFRVYDSDVLNDEDFSGGFNALEELYLRSCPKVRGKPLRKIKKLKIIELEDCKGMKEERIEVLTRVGKRVVNRKLF